MEKLINLSVLFKKNICSFKVAKKAKDAGMTCANTYFVYDSHGKLGDGAWLEQAAGLVMYPAINLPFAIAMMEDLDIKSLSEIALYQEEENYTLTFKEETYSSTNVVDILVEFWIKHRKLPNVGIV